MALRLAEVEPRDYVYVCTPTGNEPPAMFAHWRKLGELLGKPLTPIMGGTLAGLVRQQNALPNWRQRWCTRMLKIEPYAAWLAQQGECTSYVGIRADEPKREGGDYMDVPNITMRFPLREWGWGVRDVPSYLDGVMSQEDAEKSAVSNIDWDSEALPMLEWLKSNSASPEGAPR